MERGFLSQKERAFSVLCRDKIERRKEFFTFNSYKYHHESTCQEKVKQGEKKVDPHGCA